MNRSAVACICTAVLISLACGGNTTLAGGDDDVRDAEPDRPGVDDGADRDAETLDGGPDSDDAGTETADDAREDDAGPMDDAGDDVGPADDAARDDGETADDAADDGADDHGVETDAGPDVPASCGNGSLEEGEECDDGSGNNDSTPNACRTTCRRPWCGDGVVDAGERCDDGNNIDGDGCAAACFPPDVVPVEPVGEPAVVDDETDAGGEPFAAWNGTSWGLMWGAWWDVTRFRSLDADGAPLTPIAALPFMGAPAALEWNGAVYGFMAEDWTDEVIVGAVDAAGTVRAGPTWVTGLARAGDASWSGALAGWVATWAVLAGSGDAAEIRAGRFDDRASFVEGPFAVASGPMDKPRIVALPFRVGIGWVEAGGIAWRPFRWPEIASAPPAALVLPLRTTSDTGFEMDGYLDRAAIASMDGSDVWLVLVDSLSGEVTAGPVDLGDTDLGDRRPGIVAVPEQGFLAVCFGNYGVGGPPGTGALTVRLVRPDGLPLGAPLEVERGRGVGCACSLGWSGDELMLIHWVCGRDTVGNTIKTQRLRPAL